MLSGLIERAWEQTGLESLRDDNPLLIERSKTAFYMGAIATINLLQDADVDFPQSITEEFLAELRHIKSHRGVLYDDETSAQPRQGNLRKKGAETGA